jgi:hypothetical protein
MTRLRQGGLICVVAMATACGGPSPHAAQPGLSATDVEVTGRVTERGSRASILVFAYADLAPSESPAGREPTSVGTVGQDGSFVIEAAPGASLSVVFLADNLNDGVIDDGDPIATLSSPELANLQAGDRVRIGDAKINFAAHRVDATVEVVRAAAGPDRTNSSPAS